MFFNDLHNIEEVILKNILIASLLAFSSLAWSADSGPTQPSTKSVTEILLPARNAVKAENYEKAIELLTEADQKKSADWHNLMGYSLRKKASPNLNEAEKYYISALNLDANHRGALEYYGELLLLKNDLTGAEKLLARLDKACTFGCEEFRDLKKSIQQYKAKKP
jgi:Flp pilus assembly protein TadD